MIKTIAFEYHWTPTEINKMFCDGLDFKGIIFWYEECVRLTKLRNSK